MGPKLAQMPVLRGRCDRMVDGTQPYEASSGLRNRLAQASTPKANQSPDILAQVHGCVFQPLLPLRLGALPWLPSRDAFAPLQRLYPSALSPDSPFFRPARFGEKEQQSHGLPRVYAAPGLAQRHEPDVEFSKESSTCHRSYP